jgi:hypothetical protein
VLLHHILSTLLNPLMHAVPLPNYLFRSSNAGIANLLNLGVWTIAFTLLVTFFLLDLPLGPIQSKEKLTS